MGHEFVFKGETMKKEKSVPVTVYLPQNTLDRIKSSRSCLSYGFTGFINLLIDIGISEYGLEKLEKTTSPMSKAESGIIKGAK